MSIEHQNAYALSRMEYQSTCQGKEIEKLMKEGKYVLGYHQEIHCPFTDALINSEEHILSIHDSLEDAQENYKHTECSFLANPAIYNPTPSVKANLSREDSPF